MYRLNGKTALITGAAKGIGRATVERFVAEGATVIAIDRDVDNDNHESCVEWIAADVLDADAVTAAVDRACHHGRLDVCVANAGISRIEAFLDGTPASWLEVIRVNLIGVMITLQAAARYMVADGAGGRLLATASIAGMHGESHAASYGASKGGVIALMRALAVELAPYGITANAVAPGQIATALNAMDVAVMSERAGQAPNDYLMHFLSTHVPLGRMGRPDEVAAVFAFLASDDASFLSGATIRIDGGELSV